MTDIDQANKTIPHAEGKKYNSEYIPLKFTNMKHNYFC